MRAPTIVSNTPLRPLPTNKQELERCLADAEWRVFSGCLYKIMTKGDDPEGDEPQETFVLPFRPNRAQRRFVMRLWNRNLILKARQLGFTTLIAILWLDHALFNADQRCGIIAHDREAAEAIFRDKVKFAYNNLPDEIRESKKIVNDREQIMQNARIESESIIQQAEERARVLTSEQEIVKRSQQHAAEILSAAQKSAKELTRKATLYCETILKNSEEVLGRSMADIKNTRMNLRSAARPKNNMPK